MKSLHELITSAQNKKIKKRIVVASAEDEYLLPALSKLYNLGILEPILIGNKDLIIQYIRQNKLSIPMEDIYPAHSEEESVRFSVEFIREGKADILMKGLLPTKIFIKEILNKERGIRGERSLSHVGLFESPFYSKLFGVTDAAINITPDVTIKKHIIQNAVKVFHALGIDYPKVVLLAPIEKINPKMQSTVDAAEIVEEHNRKPIANCIIEGPLALDIAISGLAADHKGIQSKIAGDADILVVPEITVGNVFYKSLTYLGGAKAAGMLIGAKAPVVLSSRSDSEESKLYSMALAYNFCTTK